MYLIHCDLFVVSIYHRESSSSAKLICRKNTVCELSIECQSWHLPTVSECTNIFFFFFFMSKATKTEEYLIKIALEFTAASSPRGCRCSQFTPELDALKRKLWAKHYRGCKYEDTIHRREYETPELHLRYFVSN